MMDTHLDHVAALGGGQSRDVMLQRALGIRLKRIEMFRHA